MAKIRYEGFMGPGYSGRSISPACDRTINLYPELVESGTGKNRWTLRGTPGLRKLYDTNVEQPIRGLFGTETRILVAGEKTLYQIIEAGLSTVGAIAPDALWDGLAPVTFAWNGTQYLICSGQHTYVYDGTTLSETTNFDSIGYLDGYFVGLNQSTKQIQVSELYNGTVWNALDYGLKESAPDRPMAILADHGELWIFGTETTEVWYDSGNADFPLQRRPEGRLEVGCGAPWSPVRLDNSVFWIGSDERGNRVVWRADGYTPKRVSNHAVEYHLNQLMSGRRDQTISWLTTWFALGWAYQEEGHSFYCISFPNADPSSQTSLPEGSMGSGYTLVYDVATDSWHERAFWNKATGLYEPHRARCHCFLWDRHWVGDRANGKIYEQRLDFYDDDGERIRRERIGPHISFSMKPAFYRSFQLDMEVAVGLGAIDTSVYGATADGQEYEP